jgi:hypothetical protein
MTPVTDDPVHDRLTVIRPSSWASAIGTPRSRPGSPGMHFCRSLRCLNKIMVVRGLDGRRWRASNLPLVDIRNFPETATSIVERDCVRSHSRS